jgi:hypothetical protein
VTRAKPTLTSANAKYLQAVVRAQAAREAAEAQRIVEHFRTWNRERTAMTKKPKLFKRGLYWYYLGYLGTGVGATWQEAYSSYKHCIGDN